MQRYTQYFNKTFLCIYSKVLGLDVNAYEESDLKTFVRVITHADPPKWAEQFYPHLETESGQAGNVILTLFTITVIFLPDDKLYRTITKLTHNDRLHVCLCKALAEGLGVTH
jgi:hypothetical protein